MTTDTSSYDEWITFQAALLFIPVSATLLSDTSNIEACGDPYSGVANGLEISLYPNEILLIQSFFFSYYMDSMSMHPQAQFTGALYLLGTWLHKLLTLGHILQPLLFLSSGKTPVDLELGLVFHSKL